ncbi:hypothetical protein ACOSQ4_004829 [Xanthoceras sorbifolium]
MDWRLNYVEGFVKHLPRINSDHCSLLITLASNHILERKNKPFRFEAMWLKHSMLNKLVSDSWNQDRVRVSDKVGRLTEVLGKWNKEEFGCIFKKKRRIIARIQRVQNILSRCHKNHLATLEEKLIKEYNAIIEQEEIFWRQKSRNCWLKKY